MRRPRTPWMQCCRTRNGGSGSQTRQAGTRHQLEHPPGSLQRSGGRRRVGVRKFAFDIWGNTVNFAARMESAGAANRVNLSETTGFAVFDFIECESRGPVRIKEGREMEMYFAVGLKQELLQGPKVDGIPEAFEINTRRSSPSSRVLFPI